ncbi:MAG: ATP-dependent DNA helicase UvrD/PcrA [uncultured Thiotrichaceae bacterium]|uniref:DNA 3'-5' helicase n=1 Tax=uncultured Thiotrichaceae bacterium TaxID=298394 RepID=A0A6S6SQT0_9GAMM|nr:MAG: ATP-dependent DNA helicase UvrD/PcrA [uncultured Thiotrichaceae bacterium]
MDVSHIIDSLNEPQREAVTCGPSSQLVLAGAGSGKTRVLVHRIAWLIEVEQIPPFGILAVTFTNKAASEMRGRIEELLGTPAGGMWVGTFHGLAHRLLRRHWQEAGLPQQFQILDSDDQLRMVKRSIRSLDLDDKQWPPKQSQWYINARKDEGMRAAHIEDMGDATLQQLVNIYKTYETLCKRAGVVDFAELLLRSLELIRNNPELLQHYQQRFRHILIDEFQDTNELQYAWLRLLAGTKNPVFAVGDDDQSIYGWRGAKIENIQNFSKDYPNSRLVKMEQNYRSTSTILNAANAIIANNSSRLGKSLWTEDEHGDPIKLYSAFNEIDEASFIAGQIQRWVELGKRRKDAAILYRSNAQSRVFESTFIEQGIPYQVYGGQRFFERAEIKDALAYLRITVNRDDDTSFERIVNHPPRGIGEKTISTLRDLARSENLSLWEAANKSLQHSLLNNRAKTAIEKFVVLINELSNEIDSLVLNEQVGQVIETSCLKDHYLKREGEEKGKNRGENLDELVSAASSFNYKPEDEHVNMDFLSAFLTHAALEAGNAQGDSDEDCVQMMTMHSAKGLEFPLVFIGGLEEGLFPHQNSINEEGRLEEERRLFYVAITRARKQLFITYAEQRQLYGNTLLGSPSQFIREIPKELIEEIRPHMNAYSAPNTRAYGNTRVVEESASGFSSGDYIHHEKFGDGVIITIEGNGQSARVQINFSNVGSKWLVMGYANLQKR